MKDLLDSWKQLEVMISKSISLTEVGATSGDRSVLRKDSIHALVEGLDGIVKLRNGWRERESDPIFDRQDSEHRPLPFPEKVLDYSKIIHRLGGL